MKLRESLELVAIAVGYALIARLALWFYAVAGFAAPVWPPTGLAIAAVMFRRRSWIAVWVGAFAVNTWTGAPIASAIGIACGNAAEAFLAAWALGRWRSFDRALADVNSVIALVACAVIGATLVSATVGTTSLYAGGVITFDRIPEAWRAWWVGDALGALVVTPAILVWTRRVPAPTRKSLELALVGVVLVLVSLLVFAWSPAFQPYVVFPVLTWIAIRFGPRGSTIATIVVSAIAINAATPADLVELQLYIGFIAATFLVLAASSAERVAAIHEAERASAVKTNFLRMVSHELRAPLATLFLQIERLKTDEEPEQARKKIVDSMHAQGHRLHHLIDALLDYTRIQSGKLVLAIEPFDPRKVVADCVAELHLQAEVKNLTLTIDDAESPTTFSSDAGLLRLSIINLVNNALKFTAKGGITIVMGRTGSSLRIAVTDTGPGIAPEARARIFEPFEQLDSVRRKHTPGVGLGLALVREMMTALGGTIALDSTLGTGSTFVLELPSHDG